MTTEAFERTFYVVTTSMGGYMPNCDPEVFEPDDSSHESPTVQVLAYMRDELDRMADESCDDADTGDWEGLLAFVDSCLADEKREPAPRSVGAIFGLPDGITNLEATPYTRDELIGMGYVPGEDFES